MIKLSVNGACGRMGRRLVALASASEAFEVVEALEASGHHLLGRDIGELAGVGKTMVAVTDKPSVICEVMIDFSLPDAAGARAGYCAAHKIALVVGTTGLGQQEQAQLQAAAQQTAVLVGANMSLGVNLLFKLAGEVAKKLGQDYDIEIVETHHRFKKDAPSGTALVLGRQIAGAMGWPWPGCAVHGREGKQAERKEKTIGLHAVRAGDTVGEHQVIYAALGETIVLTHRAHTRDTFVRGALRAAQWLTGRQPGMYSMADVLGW